MEITILAVILGFIIDLMVGDPRWMYHPVQFIGLLISKFEKILRIIFKKSKTSEQIAGGILVILVLFFSVIIPIGFLFASYKLNFYFGFAVETFMCYQIMATKSLKVESMKVYEKLAKDDLCGARFAVSMIVGRETKNLDEKEITKATVETIAENAADGVIAPLFYMVIGGPVLGFLYKAINTMDSMIGYKNDRYMHFGTAAAKLDDIANYIPARFAAYIMIFSAYLCKFNIKNAYKIYKRDKKNHKSPNSAQTESVMAGALQIELAGDSIYFGKIVKKPTIGDNIKEISFEDIKNANKLLYVTAFTSLFTITLIKIVIIYII